MTEIIKVPVVLGKKTIRVTIEKEIEIELTPTCFGDMTVDEYLLAFCVGLWKIEGLDDVFMYAAEMAADCGGGYDHDGLGLLDQHYKTYPRVPDVKFRVIDESRTSEIVS